MDAPIDIFEHQAHQAHQGHQEVGASVNRIARTVVDAAFKVHRTLGPGLLESVYEHCLAHELKSRGVALQTQVALPIIYESVKLDAGYRMDIVVENAVVVEIKAIDALLRVHEAQMLTYLKFSRCRLGLLMNFNVTLLKHGLRRLVL